MLIDFRVKNFRSIKEEQILSMVASSQKEFAQTHTFLATKPNSKNLSLLKTTAIYGANAAGKTNILKAIKAMQDIVLESASKQLGDKLPITPFLFDKEAKKPSEFEVNFIYEDTRYQYGFSVTKERVMEEWLIAYPKGKAQNWFARKYDEPSQEYKWEFGDKFTGRKQLWKESTRDNALFLSTAVQLNSDQLKPVFSWFRNKLRIFRVGEILVNITAELCVDAKYKDMTLRFLKAADIDIEDIEIEKGEFNPSELPNDMPEELKKIFIEELKGKEIVKEIRFFHLGSNGEKIPLNLNEESSGTQSLFSFIGLWIYSLEDGNVIFVDELHNSFHPLMVKFLIEMFHNKDMNTSNAQLIFTTHETSVLSQHIFRRDQIWFCEKQNQATTLYPLSDFSPRKGVEDLEKGYLSGRYGALPFFEDISAAMRK